MEATSLYGMRPPSIALIRRPNRHTYPFFSISPPASYLYPISRPFWHRPLHCDEAIYSSQGKDISLIHNGHRKVLAVPAIHVQHGWNFTPITTSYRCGHEHDGARLNTVHASRGTETNSKATHLTNQHTGMLNPAFQQSVRSCLPFAKLR